MRIYIETKRYSLESVKNAWIYLYFRKKQYYARTSVTLEK